MTYKTISGDTWDSIAYKLYGNELFCDKLMDANRDLLDYMVFPDNITLNVPEKSEIEESTVTSDDPNWRIAIE